MFHSNVLKQKKFMFSVCIRLIIKEFLERVFIKA